MWLLSWQNVCWGMRLPSQWLLCVLDLSGPPNHIQWSWLKSNSIIEKKLLLFEMKFSPKRFWNRKIICLFSYTCLRLLTVFLLLWWSFVLKKRHLVFDFRSQPVFVMVPICLWESSFQWAKQCSCSVPGMTTAAAISGRAIGVWKALLSAAL